MSKEVDSTISQLYDIKKLLGSGAYGHVWKAVDKQSGKEVALKKIFDAFHNDVDAQRTYREISVLHELDHYNIIKLLRVLKAKNNKDLYLVFEFMEADLQSLVGEQILEDVHTRFVVYQILRAMKYVHSAQLIHRDLKPSNILINSDCQIKICDFGLVRSLAHQQDEPIILSEQVATRWYRSPQVLLGSRKYGKETDVWSIGCIVAELVMGEPLFPGDSTLTQLEKILTFTGVPSKHAIESMESDVAQSLINQLTVHKKPMQEYFKQGNKGLIGLVGKMLQFSPEKRITIDQALQLDIFAEFRTGKAMEDICTKFIVPQLDDNKRLTLQQYRKMIYCDIDRRYPQISVTKSVSLDKSREKENKKVLRSHHSFNRQKSTENFRKPNQSLHVRQKMKKQVSCSTHINGDAEQIIKALKKDWKKSPVSTNTQSYNHSYSNSNNDNEKDDKADTDISGKMSSFYKGLQQRNGLQKEKSSTNLTKVRSRKLLVKTKSRDKLVNMDPPQGLLRKKVVR